MRPNTISSGILSTKRSSPVSTSRLTRMLVPKPKNAFQSPGVQIAGFDSALALAIRILPPSDEGSHNPFTVGDPTKNAALGLDHAQAHGVKLGEVRRAAVARHDAAVAAIVGLAHRRVHAHLRGDAAHDQALDAAVLQDGAEIGGVEGALAWLVDHGLALDRVELGDDVVARFAADQDAAHGARRADAHAGRAALDLGAWGVAQVRAVALARVDHQNALLARRAQQAPDGIDRGAQQRDVVA